MMNSLAKVIQVNIRRPDGMFMHQFARGDNEMIIGSVMNGGVTWGENPRDPQQRAFLNDESGIAFMREKCREMLGREDIDFEVRNEDDKIITKDLHRLTPPNLIRKN